MSILVQTKAESTLIISHSTFSASSSARPVLPEAVGKTLKEQSATETEYLTVDYQRIVPLLIEGIKELKTKVETLETENTAIKARLDALEA